MVGDILLAYSRNGKEILRNLSCKAGMSGESRVLRVSWLNSKLSLQDAPPVFAALGVIGVGDMLKPYM